MNNSKETFEFKPHLQEISDVEVIGTPSTLDSTNPNKPAEAASYGMGAHFEKAGITAASFPAEKPEAPVASAANETFEKGTAGTVNENKAPRGGRGTKGAPDEIKEAIEEAQKIEVKIDHDFAKLKKHKDDLVRTLAKLHLQETEALRRGVSLDLQKKLRGKVDRAQASLDKINGILPKTTENGAPSEHQAILKIVEDYRKNKDVLKKLYSKIGKAENDLKKKPGDGRIQGEENRAQAEKAIVETNLAKIAADAEQLLAKTEAPSLSEEAGLSYTHAQAVADRKEWEERHKNAQADAVLESVPAENEIEFESQAVEKSAQENYAEGWERIWGKKETEKNNSEIPTLTEVVEEPIAKFELSERARSGLNPEQLELFEKVQEGISNAEKSATEQVKKAGMPEKMLGLLRKGGESYSKLPLKTKLLVSIALFGVAWAAGGTIASVAIGGSAIQRALGGMATFVAAEGALKASAEKGGGGRGKFEKSRHTAEALLAGFLVGGGALGLAINNALAEGLPSHETATAPVETDAEKIEKLRSEIMPKANLAALDTAPNTDYTAVAEAGDSRWTLVGEALAKGPYEKEFSLLPQGQQEYVIDAIKDKLTAGMTAEQANMLNVGDEIDFKEIFADKDFIEKTFADAQNLSTPELENIANYNPDEVADAPTVKEIFEPKVMDFSPHGALEGSSSPVPTIPSEILPGDPPKIIENFSLENLSTPDAPTLTENLASISPIFTPSDPQILIYAKEVTDNNIQSVFGKVGGFLGFGSSDGQEIFKNFADKPVDQFIGTKAPSVLTVDEGKMKELIEKSVEQTHVKSMPGEKVVDYLNRSAAINIERFTKNG
ncbi:MAG: hypothetical protein Q7K40_01695 [bacterium]|nr:hypothetical protein [bacterium]